MADEEVEPRPEDREGTTQSSKKKSQKSRPAVTKSDSESEPAAESSVAAEASTDEDAGADEGVNPPAEKAPPAPKAAAPQEPAASSKSRSKMQLHQFERRGGKRRR